VISDLRVELRWRNNVLWHAIRDVYPSVAAFCRAHGCNEQKVGAYLNLVESPYRAFRRPSAFEDVAPDAPDPDVLKPSARTLCEATGLGPEELFPVVLYSGIVPPRQIAEVSAVQVLQQLRRSHPVAAIAERVVHEGDCRENVSRVLGTLTPREERVMRLQFGLDGNEQTQAEIARTLGISETRVHQLSAKALRRLRHSSRSKTLRPFVDAIEVAR
jgi:RNA polymerase sigma factor (sigma-70 family)